MGSHQRPNSENLVDQHIGSVLRDLRTEAGMTSADLASRVGVSALDLRQFECGSLRIKPDILSLLAQSLGVNVVVFFEGFPHPRPVQSAPANLLPFRRPVHQKT